MPSKANQYQIGCSFIILSILSVFMVYSALYPSTALKFIPLLVSPANATQHAADNMHHYFIDCKNKGYSCKRHRLDIDGQFYACNAEGGGDCTSTARQSKHRYIVCDWWCANILLLPVAHTCQRHASCILYFFQCLGRFADACSCSCDHQRLLPSVPCYNSTCVLLLSVWIKSMESTFKTHGQNCDEDDCEVSGSTVETLQKLYIFPKQGSFYFFEAAWSRCLDVIRWIFVWGPVWLPRHRIVSYSLIDRYLDRGMHVHGQALWVTWTLRVDTSHVSC